MKTNKSQLPFLLVLLGFVTASVEAGLPTGNTYVCFSLYWLILWFFNVERKKNGLKFYSYNYKIVAWYLIWAVMGCIRGLFVAENYWEYKTWAEVSTNVLFPICVYSFYSPKICGEIISKWLRFGIPLFFLLFIFFIKPTQTYFGFVYFLACFIPLINSKPWRWVIFIFLLFFLTNDIADQRSPFIKAVMASLVAIGCFAKKIVGERLIRLSHVFLLSLPFIFFFLGVSGVFNIFSDTSSKYEGRYQSSNEDSSDAAADTRTFIYVEVLTSAIENNYVLFGRTPARGNDTDAFAGIADELASQKNDKTIKAERTKNELCFLNIFTWLGLIGMFLYMFIYIYASYLGVYKSKNFYIKMAGIVTAFNFAFGWIENCVNFDLINITYWLFISMCLSPEFRRMTDDDFKSWLNSFFVKGRKSSAKVSHVRYSLENGNKI